MLQGLLLVFNNIVLRTLSGEPTMAVHYLSRFKFIQHAKARARFLLPVKNR